MSDLVEDLKAGAAELRETHISWVFLLANSVFKVKKPVNFGFLDFSDLDSRRRACDAEVELNSRLAPGVYLGVVPVTRDEHGVHRIKGAGQIVDWAVAMRRLPDAERADLRLEAGQLEWQQLEALAASIARFHAGSATTPEIAEHGRVDRISENVRENFAQAHQALAHLVSEAQQREIEGWQLGFLEQHEELFERRVQQSKIRDGHGDLRLEHVYIDAHARPLVIDCIEFNQRFRFGDVCSDVAFLSMDLAWHGRVDLKERFLAAYARESNDHDLYALVDFYESYRAYVRAKVNALGYSSPHVSFDTRQRLERQARRYFLLALASERPALGAARLIAIGGAIASGKSTLADALAAELAVPVLSSDRTRKFLAGVSPTSPLQAPAWSGEYAERYTENVYAELLRQAGVVLASGRSVVIDASFRSSVTRAGVKALAGASGAAFVFVECQVPDAVQRARLATRQQELSVSDGRLDILNEFMARYEPVVELDASEHVRVDTSGGLTVSLEALRRSGIAPPR